MICEDMANYAANKALRKLGIRTEETAQPVIAETPRQFNDGAATAKGLVEPTAPFMTVGNRNLVVWDGTPYVCVSEKQGVHIVLGNPVIGEWGNEDNGMPFAILADVEKDGSIFISFYTYYGDYDFHTVGVYNLVETIHPISDKYLPEGFGGGGLPVVEIATNIVPTPPESLSVALSDGEIAALTKAGQIGTPCVISTGFMMGKLQIVCNLFTTAEGTYSFIGNIAMAGASLTANISNTGGEWVAETAWVMPQ